MVRGSDNQCWHTVVKLRMGRLGAFGRSTGTTPQSVRSWVPGALELVHRGTDDNLYHQGTRRLVRMDAWNPRSARLGPGVTHGVDRNEVESVATTARLLSWERPGSELDHSGHPGRAQLNAVSCGHHPSFCMRFGSDETQTGPPHGRIRERIFVERHTNRCANGLVGGLWSRLGQNFCVVTGGLVWPRREATCPTAHPAALGRDPYGSDAIADDDDRNWAGQLLRPLLLRRTQRRVSAGMERRLLRR